MHPSLNVWVHEEARAKQLVVDSSFEPRVDAYIKRHFASRNAYEQLIIETYLTQAALRIAKIEGKSQVDGEDIKAAVWLFHQPDQPDDPCATAGLRALKEEGARGPGKHGMLMESFAKRIDTMFNRK